MVPEGRKAVRRVAAARLVSLTGSGAAFAALAYLVYRLTGASSAWVSLTLLLTLGVQGIAQPLVSWLGDRADRKRVLVASDLLSTVGFMALALMRSPGQLVTVACATAIVASPVFAVSSAVVPNLVDEKDLAWANGRIALGRSVGNLVGPILGGAIVAALAPGRHPTGGQLHEAGLWVFGFNALTFLVSAWLVGTTRGRFNDERPAEPQYRGVRAGFRFVARDRVLRAILLAWVVMLVGAGLILVAEVALADSFGKGSLGYGLLSALWGGGAAVGSLLAGRVLTARREGNAFTLSILAASVGLFLIAASPWWILVLLLMGALGMTDGLGTVAEQGIIQRRTPDEVRSRVGGAIETAALLAFAASFGFGGFLVDAFGPRVAYTVGGAAALLATLVLVGPLRSVSREPAPSAG
ncbi:MAG: MFS transporter [Actinobacteria bacterium]|nr:MFS transporter [Actinomycetota bacterium]